MKKILTIIAIVGLLVANRTMAQVIPDTGEKADSLKSGMQEGHKLATGTSLDILSNYLQVAAKNLTSSNNSVQLKLSWFALNPMDSAHKYENTNFISSAWQRNGQFIFSGGMDKNNKINSFTAGLTYNFLDRRDTAMYYYTAAYQDYFPIVGIIQQDAVNNLKPGVKAVIAFKMDSLLNKVLLAGKRISDLKTKIDNGIPGLLQGHTSDDAIVKTVQDQLNADLADTKVNRNTLSSSLIAKIDTFSEYAAGEYITIPLNTYMNGSNKKPLSFAQFVTAKQTSDVSKLIDDEVKNNKTLHGILKANTIADVNKKVLANYEELIKYVSRQPLLTFGYLYTYGTGTLLSSHVAGVTYLQGLGSIKSTKIGQLNASLTDTLTGTDPTGKVRNFGRNIIALQGGYNQILAMQKKVSVMEINGALEEDWATNGYVLGANKSKFFFDAYFRVRLPTTPWLKFDLKWAPGGNVAGLIDFTYNIDNK